MNEKKFNQIALVVYMLLALIFVQKLSLVILSIEWVDYFKLENFSTIDDMKNFYINLRTGVSPVLSFFEISEFLLTGKNDFIRFYFSRAVIILNFIFAAYLFGSTKSKSYRLIISIPIVYGVSLIGGMNYDWYWPFFTLLFLFFLKISENKNRYVGVIIFFSGAFLSFAELSRPFVILTLPFFILYAHKKLRAKNKKKLFIIFLLPIFIFSGGWRVKLFSYNSPQIIWSDYGGCNLFEAWPGVGYKVPYSYINTDEGAKLCKEGKEKVLKHMISNPGETVIVSFKKIWSFMKSKANWHGMKEGVKVNFLYRLILKILFFIFVISGFQLLYKLLRNPKLFLREDSLIKVPIYMYFLFLAILNDGSERARFIVSFSPFLIMLSNFETFEGIFEKVKSKMRLKS
ncbi:hypothetical protein [Halobacteriovorax sp. JY17]|uniref:hypothetical protein n=1 Tax=Halobacteriovorax sp. JY17 TaxID=2014617 RepID=UPI000C6793E5|nr:hypothetical protein [Halobacteriovorax sp. JY17]PIK14703.1 MAG: hypothetical protein CES88_10215 [Halobacteriovorax sp. JY17]